MIAKKFIGDTDENKLGKTEKNLKKKAEKKSSKRKREEKKKAFEKRKKKFAPEKSGLNQSTLNRFFLTRTNLDIMFS